MHCICCLGFQSQTVDVKCPPCCQLKLAHHQTFAQLHERSESLRTQIGSLELLSGVYNGVRNTVQPIEQPLLQAKLDAVDAELQSGLLVCPVTRCYLRAQCCEQRLQALLWE